jgi:hypothetical protein
MKVRFLEIDCGPGGIVWEMHGQDNQFIRSYGSENDMLKDAALAKMLGHDLRFHTQAEYMLEVSVEIMLENGVWNGQETIFA